MRPILMILAAVLLIFPGVAQAQTTLMEATIPFDFYCGDKVLPAGEYSVHPVLPQVVMVLGRESPWNGGMRTFDIAEKTGYETQSKLVFTKYFGDRIFLSQIWRAGSETGLKLVMSRTEREAVTSKVITRDQPRTITILAKVR